MEYTTAMVDPGAGAGGGLALLSLVISLTAGILHFESTRYWLICFVSGMALFLLSTAAWVCLDVLNPEAGDRMYVSMPLLPLSFLLPFIGAAIAGLPAVAVRLANRLRRRAKDGA